MVNGYLIDTNSVIDYLDNKLPAKLEGVVKMSWSPLFISWSLRG